MPYYNITENIIATTPTYDKKIKMNNAAQTILITCIALPESLIFIDCGVYFKFAEKFREEMEKKFQRKTSHLFLTHTHWDHILAMNVFKDVDIVVSQKGFSSLKNNLKGYLSFDELQNYAQQYAEEDPILTEDIRKAQLFLPNIRVKDELTITSGTHEIIFKVIGNHTAGSAHLYYPQGKVLCSGDNLLECYPQLLASNWESLDLLRSWEEMDIKYVIPGHGKPVTKEYITKVRQYYEDLISFLKQEINKKTSLKDILKNPQLPAYFGTKQTDWQYACRFGANWLTDVIEDWYRFLKKQKN